MFAETVWESCSSLSSLPHIYNKNDFWGSDWVTLGGRFLILQGTLQLTTKSDLTVQTVDILYQQTLNV